MEVYDRDPKLVASELLSKALLKAADVISTVDDKAVDASRAAALARGMPLSQVAQIDRLTVAIALLRMRAKEVSHG